VEILSIIQYQASTHLSSVALELGETGKIISYEEYSPYGTTTFHSTLSELKVPKRYRFSAKELDQETGLLYFGRRYLASGIARWISPDPLCLGDGLNVFCYFGNDPINTVDLRGLYGNDAQSKTWNARNVENRAPNSSSSSSRTDSNRAGKNPGHILFDLRSDKPF
jgi:RHS repeat-associated protein